MTKIIPAIERFWKFVEPEPNTGCWLWSGTIVGGYGWFHVCGSRKKGNKKNSPAHKFIYEHIKGKVPDGLELDHLCREKSCVNPAHLEAVTHKENVLRGVGACSVNARKTHCAKGHEFNEENTWRGKSRIERTCRACNRKHHKKYWEENKEKIKEQRRQRKLRKAA